MILENSIVHENDMKDELPALHSFCIIHGMAYSCMDSSDSPRLDSNRSQGPRGVLLHRSSNLNWTDQDPGLPMQNSGNRDQ